jgi:hypothetical protein
MPRSFTLPAAAALAKCRKEIKLAGHHFPRDPNTPIDQINKVAETVLTCLLRIGFYQSSIRNQFGRWV